MSAPTCTTAEVAAIIPERCLDSGGDFTTSTHPTAAQVGALITQIATEVMSVVGASVDSSLDSYAHLVVATGVAAQVELAFTNDVAQDANSKYEWLQDQYWGDGPDSKGGIGGRLKLLADAQADIVAGGDLGTVEDPRPWATFPDSALPGFPMTTWVERY